MRINNDVVEAIGNTPLIKLKHASEATGCTILGKAEFMNPGQSVKDRAGKWMILGAEKRGGRKRPRLSYADPDSGNAEPGKEGHAAAVRGRTRGGAAAPLLQPEQLPACRQAPRCAASQDRAERR